MASRKEQKEKLRREREEREAAQRQAARRRRLIGYAAGAALVILALAAAGFALLSGDGEEAGSGETQGDVLPEGGSMSEQEITALDEAAEAAGCELKSFPGRRINRVHLEDPNAVPEYSSNPPSEGRHVDEAAADGAYEEAPEVRLLVHSLEHGRVITWFKKDLPAEQRANMQAFFDEEPYQMVLVPNETDMPYEVAATAWNLDPEPAGTGRLLGCPEYNEKIFDALRTFRDEHRGRGPEAIP